MFVEWSCGCKGIRSGDSCVVIDDCEGEGYLMAAYREDLQHKSFKPMNEKAQHDFVFRMGRQFLAGYKFQQIEKLLGFN